MSLKLNTTAKSIPSEIDGVSYIPIVDPNTDATVALISIEPYNIENVQDSTVIEKGNEVKKLAFVLGLGFAKFYKHSFGEEPLNSTSLGKLDNIYLNS